MITGVTTENLVVGYGKTPLLSDVNLCVEPGKIVTLIGPNGSGKSTILKSITRQLKSLGGVIKVGEVSMKEMKDTDVAKKISMVMTERLKPEYMSCRDVVATGRYPYTGRLGILSKEDEVAVSKAMVLVQADETGDKNFLEISDGQRQRVMLARAICQESDILVLDEPTSYLDIRYKLDILQNIRKLSKEKNLAVIMSLHELDLALKLSDIIVCVDGKRVRKIGTPEEVFQNHFIQDLYGIKEEVFNPLTGEVFLSGKKEKPEVMVISGGGCGLGTFQLLARRGISFATGILYENDLEYKEAQAMAGVVLGTKGFYPVKEELMKKGMNLLDECKKCICCLGEFGPYNEANERLYEYAKAKGYVIGVEQL